MSVPLVQALYHNTFILSVTKLFAPFLDDSEELPVLTNSVLSFVRCRLEFVFLG